MIHEIKLAYTKIDNNGNDKVVKERYLIEDASCFGDAETKTYEYAQGVLPDNTIDVVEIKRSKIKEILNKRASDDEKIFIADVADIQMNDDGEEVELIYKLVLFAKNLDEAYKRLKIILEQGYGFVPIGMRKTKFIDVING